MTAAATVLRSAKQMLAYQIPEDATHRHATPRPSVWWPFRAQGSTPGRVDADDPERKAMHGANEMRERMNYVFGIRESAYPAIPFHVPSAGNAQFYSAIPWRSLSIGQRHQQPQNIGVSNAPTTLLNPHVMLSFSRFFHLLPLRP